MKKTFSFLMLFVAISFASHGSSAVAFPRQESTPSNNQQLEILELDEQAIADLSKFRIERPVEKLLVNQTEKQTEYQTEEQTDPATPERPVTPADLTKRVIETPVEALVPRSSPAVAESTPDSTTTESVNPKCQPGLVNWHPDFETACAASRQSGRPVMLFQLLGQLDERFT